MICQLAYFAQLEDPTIGPVVNHTTGSLPSNGVTVFLLGQCQGLGCPVPIGSNFTVDFIIDLTGISTTFTIAFTDQTWSLAILACNPNITIETREVRNEGYGLLSVQALPAGAQLSRQGNLNPIQTTALLSIVATSLWSNTGSLISVPNHNPDLGSQVLGEVLFGKAQYDNLPGPDSAPGETVTVTPAPIANITQGYIQILQSTAKRTLLELVFLSLSCLTYAPYVAQLISRATSAPPTSRDVSLTPNSSLLRPSRTWPSRLRSLHS